MVTVNVVPVVNSYESKDFREIFLQRFMKDPKIRVRHQEAKSVNAMGTGSSRRTCVVDVRTYSEFKIFLANISPDKFVYQGYYLIVLTKGEIDEIQDIFADLWKLEIYNVIVIFEDDYGHVAVLTFFPFRSSTDCSNTTPVLINKFINGTFTRGLSNIFLNKMENLQHCEIRVSTSARSTPYIFLKTGQDGITRFYGRDYELILALSQGMNFKINFTYIGYHGYSLINGTMTDALGALQNNDADLAIADFWLKPYRLKFFDASSSYISEQLAFVFPTPGELISLDRLHYPLELPIWLLLIVYLLIGTVTIFLINRQSRNVQHFVIGRKVRYPYFNIWIGILGTTQHRLPGRNFSRFLLMNFLIFTLVMRAAYQGKMYYFLQSNMRYPEPQSIQDMIDHDYEFEFFQGHLDLVADLNRFENRRITNENFEYVKWFRNAKPKTTVIASYSSYIDTLILDTALNLQFCREVFLIMPSVILTRKNFYLLQAINDHIDSLTSSGLIKFWHDKQLYGYRKRNVSEKDPKILNFEHLSGCFQLLGGGCLISLVVFLMEFVLMKWKRRMNGGKTVRKDGTKAYKNCRFRITCSNLINTGGFCHFVCVCCAIAIMFMVYVLIWCFIF
ncbi:hypothetical protein ACKWTF_010225 [Chironomus riparius]